MCDPKNLSMFAGGVNAIGALKQGASADAAGRYNEAVANIEALDALKRGSNEESRYRRELAQVSGQQRSEAGARNVARSGTALDLIEDTAAIGEEDIVTIRNNAAREAFGLRTQGAEMKRQGRASKRTSRLQAAGSLLTGGAQAYGYWNK